MNIYKSILEAAQEVTQQKIVAQQLIDKLRKRKVADLTITTDYDADEINSVLAESFSASTDPKDIVVAYGSINELNFDALVHTINPADEKQYFDGNTYTYYLEYKTFLLAVSVLDNESTLRIILGKDIDQ